MASFRYLWKSRAKFPISSPKFYRAWAKRLFALSELLKKNGRRSLLLSKGAVVHETAEIGKIDLEGAKNLLTVGAYSFLGKVSIALHDEVVIGKNVCINDGVRMLTASHDVSDPLWTLVKGKIIIHDYVWIGTGATILPGVELGRGAVVGAAAVVSKSVPAGFIVVGNPAKPVSKTRCDDLSYNPCEFLAENRAWLVG